MEINCQCSSAQQLGHGRLLHEGGTPTIFYTKREHRQSGRFLLEGGTPTIWPPFTRGWNTENMAAFYSREEHRQYGRLLHEGGTPTIWPPFTRGRNLPNNISKLRRYTAIKDLVAVYDNMDNGCCSHLLYKDGTKRACLYFTGGWYTIEIAETVQNHISPDIILTALDPERKNPPVHMFTASEKAYFIALN